MGRRTVVATILGAYGVTWAVSRCLRRVVGASMLPRLAPGDLLVVVPRWLARPRRGAVVVVADPRQPSRATVKRVVAVPGDRVDVDEGHLFLGGSWYDEPYATFHLDPILHWRLGPEQFLVLGDNRPASTDSRTYGPVDAGAIRGVAVARVRPWEAGLRLPAVGREGPRVRPNVRIVLLDTDDRVLLLRNLDPHDPTATPFWYQPGGGIDPGEDAPTAALRELVEETGLRQVELGPLVWTRTAADVINGKPFQHVEQYFVVRTVDTTVDRSGWSAFERAATIDVRWWSRDELATTDDVVYPERFVDHLTALLTEGPPAAPIDISV